jgi:hypothetical protein
MQSAAQEIIQVQVMAVQVKNGRQDLALITQAAAVEVLIITTQVQPLEVLAA